MSKKITVIHHSADFDGLFCREIAKRALGDQAEYIGWDYGDPVPEVPAENLLYLLDISIESLMTHPNLIWIDHHRTAIDKWPAEKCIQGYRIDGVAACRLAWQWFFNPQGPRHHRIPANLERKYLPSKEVYVTHDVDEPYSVRLAGEYDIWDKRDPSAEIFQFGLRSQELTARHWDDLLDFSSNLMPTLLANGLLLQRYQQATDASVVKYRSYTLDFHGLKLIVLNTARCNSLTFTAALRPEHDGCMGFFYNGEKWKVSLYGVPGKPDVDLSRIALQYGGGGHKQACGFECQQLPFMEKVSSY